MFAELVDELITAPSSELEAVVRQAELDRRAAEARIAAASAVIDGRQSYRDDGHYSMRCFLKATLNCSGRTANRIRKRAALVNDHREVGDTWLKGHIGTDQVDTLTNAHSHPRAGSKFGVVVAVLIDQAEHLEHRGFEQCVDHFIELADPDGSFDDQQFHDDERTASVTITNGAVDVRASGGDVLSAAEIDAVFKLAVEAEFEKDCATRRARFGDDALNHPLPRTTRQRAFDALHQIFLSWATVPAGGVTPQPLVNVVIDHTTAAQVLARHGLVDQADVVGLVDQADVVGLVDQADVVGLDSGSFDRGPLDGRLRPIDLLGRRCHTSTGSNIHPDMTLAAMIRGHVRRVIVDSSGVVIDMGRSRRLFTGKAREAARLLATSCTYRGCDIPAEFCDVDHLDEWDAHHGRTDQANAAPVCGHHNRYKHEHRLRTRRTADGRIRLLRPDGTLIGPVGEREPLWADEHRLAAATS